MSDSVPAEIFKAYDIRGLYGEQLDPVLRAASLGLVGAVDPAAFRVELEEANVHPEGITERVRQRFADLPGDQLLSWFRDQRSAMVRVATANKASCKP